MLTVKFIAVNAYTKKEERYQMKKFHLKNWEKEEQTEKQTERRE